MADQQFPDMTKELAEKKGKLAPENLEAWRNFSSTVFKAGAVSEQTKQALRKGVTKEEIMEAIWVASEMRAGAAYAHATIAMDEMEKYG